MTVKDLIEALSVLPPTLEVRRHDSDYGASQIEDVTLKYIIVERRCAWTEPTEAEAREVADIDETVVQICEIR